MRKTLLCGTEKKERKWKEKGEKRKIRNGIWSENGMKLLL
jgi:hypothetical protein